MWTLRSRPCLSRSNIATILTAVHIYIGEAKCIQRLQTKDLSNSNQICAICLNDLKTDIKIISSTIPIKDSKSEINEEVPINSSNAKCNFSLNVIICKRETHSNILMITPCHHYFHPECLQEWCKHKSKCPICRHDLPSID